MKNVLFASVALAAVAVAAPAFAQDTASGYVGAAYSNTDIEDEGSDTWALDGAVAFKPTETLGVQIDASYANEESDSVSETETLNATAHLFTRNDAWAVGGFAGVTDVDNVTAWNVGAEGAMYFDQITVAGTVAYTDVDDLNVDAWGLGGEVRYFVTDNFRLNTGLGWASAEDENLLTFSVGGEYQFAESPFSAFAGFSHTKFDELDIEADRFTVGFRYNFGGQTLKGRDRSGASFQGAEPVFGGLI